MSRLPAPGNIRLDSHPAELVRIANLTASEL
jgi:hypothetical protein